MADRLPQRLCLPRLRPARLMLRAGRGTLVALSARALALALACLLMQLSLVPFALATESTPAPQRIVSLNLCTDQLLFELVDEPRILLLSQLAADESLSFYADRAKQKPRFNGSVEAILALEPDLVLAGSQASYGPVSTLQRVGVNVAVIEMPESIEGTISLIHQIADLVGESDKGHVLASSTLARLESIQTQPKASNPPLAVIYLPNGLSPGPGTLKHELVTLAGFRNLAAELGFSGYGTINIETLLKAKPGLVIVDSADLEHASLAQQLLHHPALESAAQKTAILKIPTPTWICAGPQIIHAARTLSDARNQATPHSHYLR